jgi:hypothetical protein
MGAQRLMEKIVLVSILFILAGCYQKQDEYYVNITPCEHCMEQLATTIDHSDPSYNDDMLEELVS